jgi:hypothetical protein
METEINDVYFRRFLVPITITLLLLIGMAVIIATPPGTPIKWLTFNTVSGGQIAGALRFLRK